MFGRELRLHQRYTGGMCAENTLPKSSVSFRCGLNTGTRQFGKFGTLTKNTPGNRYTLPTTPLQTLGCLAIYLIILGWKTYKCYHETDEIPNPKANPTQEKQVKKKLSGHSSHSKYLFVGWDILYTGNRQQETQPNQNSPQTPCSDVE